MSKLRHATAVAMLAGLFLAGTTSGAEARQARNNVRSSADDAALAAADQQAQKTLPIFWAKFDAQTPGVSRYLVKVALKARGGGREMLWAAVLRRSATWVQVRLADEAEYVEDVSIGAVVRVAPDQIVDWSYVKNGRAYGNYSTRVLINRVTPEQRAEAAAYLAPTPLESETR